MEEGLEYALKERYFADVEEKRAVGPCPTLEGSFWKFVGINDQVGELEHNSPLVWPGHDHSQMAAGCLKQCC